MRLLVTGASGLIGRHTALAAFAAGCAVTAVGRWRAPGLPAGIGFLETDLVDANAAAAAVHEVAPTHIIHAAWETRQPSYWDDPINLDWVISTTRMANAFAASGGRRFVQIGSCAEYAWTSGGERHDAPATRYGKAKLSAFRAIEAAGHGRFATVEARIFWVYGPGENSSRFVPLICRAHAIGNVPQLGSGRQERDLLYVEDAAHALLALLADGAPVGIVDIGSGQGTPLSEVASILARLAGSRLTGLSARPDRSDDPARLVADSAPLRTTGWHPRVTLADGLARTYSWWKEQGGQA